MLNYVTVRHMNNSDIYFKKIITYNYRGKELKFRVSQDLFSSHDIDIGTGHLLRTLTSEGFSTYNKVLDLGCGYGPIGISLKSAYQPSVIHMVDRDALALNFSRQNVELNNLGGIKIYGSLGYDDVSERNFDLIVSNIPAKVGEPVLSNMLEDAKFYLRPGGKVAVVVIDEIGEYITKVLKSNKDINIIFYKRWPGHLVFHYEFSKDSFAKPVPKSRAFDRGVYNRSQKDFSVDDSKISIETAYGLPEFDTLSYETEILLNKMNAFKGQQINRAIIFNPGQGFIPIALSTISEVEELDLVDRNLEALRMSKRNMISKGYDDNKIFLFHEVRLSKVNCGLADCVIGILDDKDDPKIHSMIVKEAIQKLSTEGIIMLASASTPITRIETLVRREKLLNILERKKIKGKSFIIMKSKG